MDEILYDSITRYYATLSNVGYVSYDDMQGLLFLSAVQEFVYKDFKGFITEADYREIEKALYKVFGTSCLVPYPEFCNNKGMNKLHLGDLSEIYYRIKRDNAIDRAIRNLQKMEVVKTQHECCEEWVPDIKTDRECCCEPCYSAPPPSHYHPHHPPHHPYPPYHHHLPHGKELEEGCDCEEGE